MTAGLLAPLAFSRGLFVALRFTCPMRVLGFLMMSFRSTLVAVQVRTARLACCVVDVV